MCSKEKINMFLIYTTETLPLSNELLQQQKSNMYQMPVSADNQSN